MSADKKTEALGPETLARLKFIKAKIDAGLAPQAAVHLWNALTADRRQQLISDLQERPIE